MDVIVGKPGSTSDINIWREGHSKLAATQKFQGDKGYIGEAQIETPKKKPKNRELNQEEKHSNREKASKRILVEHIIRLVKIFRIAQERFRLKLESYPKIILTVCGLVRLRISALFINSFN